MITDRTGMVIILTVDIHPKASCKCWVHRTRYDRRPPAIGDAMLPELFYRYSRLAGDDACCWVPRNDAVHPCYLKDDALGSDRCIAIASACTAQRYFSSRFFCKFEYFFDTVSSCRTKNVPDALNSPAPADEPLKTILWDNGHQKFSRRNRNEGIRCKMNDTIRNLLGTYFTIEPFAAASTICFAVSATGYAATAVF